MRINILRLSFCVVLFFASGANAKSRKPASSSNTVIEAVQRAIEQKVDGQLNACGKCDCARGYIDFIRSALKTNSGELPFHKKREINHDNGAQSATDRPSALKRYFFSPKTRRYVSYPAGWNKRYYSYPRYVDSRGYVSYPGGLGRSALLEQLKALEADLNWLECEQTAVRREYLEVLQELEAKLKGEK